MSVVLTIIESTPSVPTVSKMPVKLRSAGRPKTITKGSLPYKSHCKKRMVKTAPETSNYIRDRDLKIITDTETEYESDVQAPKSVPRPNFEREKVSLKRDLDENMNELSPTKRPRFSDEKPPAEVKKPRRSTRNTAKRRQTLARAARRKEAELRDSKHRKSIEIAALKLFENNDVINFMDIVNL